MRVRIDLAYDGTDFNGWAMQPGLRTVEGDLGAALAQVLRLPRPPRIAVAGRTDAGVHARAQTTHVDLPLAAIEAATPGRSRAPRGGWGDDPPPLRPFDAMDGLRHRLSGVLGADIVVHRVSAAPPGFHARFAALRRRYVYRLCDDARQLDPLRRHEVLVVRGPVDVDAMNLASANLLGLNNFAAFCRPREGATTVRTLLELAWVRDGAQIAATVVADAFCHSMVRALVGAVLEVGRGRRPVGWPAEVLATEAREATAPVVPAHGLCLEAVTYPSEALMAQRVTQARVRRDMMT